MPGRRRAREYALQVLYQVDLTEVSAEQALRGFWIGFRDEDLTPGTAPVTREESDFTRVLVEGVCTERERIDALIENASLNWRLTRMPIVDRNILRMACFELLARVDIPVSVTINEAVELAKRYGGADSRAFVNGILDRIAHDTGRGGRGAPRTE